MIQNFLKIHSGGHLKEIEIYEHDKLNTLISSLTRPQKEILTFGVFTDIGQVDIAIDELNRSSDRSHSYLFKGSIIKTENTSFKNCYVSGRLYFKEVVSQMLDTQIELQFDKH